MTMPASRGQDGQGQPRPGQEKGSGLGLAIMKNIGERHGIQIRIESEPEKGTSVVFCVKTGSMSEK